jgi:hypothetical protein
MLLLMTPTALNSRFVKMEFRWFMNHKPGNLFPVMCEDTDLPFDLDGIQYTAFDEIESLVSSW